LHPVSYTSTRMADNNTVVQTITSERDLVLQNIQQLEQNINTLTQQLTQSQQNLIASKGAVMGYDRLLSAFSTDAAVPAEPVEVVANN